MAYVDSKGRPMYPHEVGGTVVPDEDVFVEQVAEATGEVSEGVEFPADGTEAELVVGEPADAEPADVAEEPAVEKDWNEWQDDSEGMAH